MRNRMDGITAKEAAAIIKKAGLPKYPGRWNREREIYFGIWSIRDSEEFKRLRDEFLESKNEGKEENDA